MLCLHVAAVLIFVLLALQLVVGKDSITPGHRVGVESELPQFTFH